MLTYSTTCEQPVRPKRLRFGLLSAKEIERMSVCKVTETTLYYRGLPASAGLLDPLMGSVDRRHMCASCHRDARSCQGHPGHIELSFPMFHIGFVDTVLKTLRTTCFCCARVCATPEDVAATQELQGKSRLVALHNALRNRKTCIWCGMTRPVYTRTSLGIRIDWPSDMEWSTEAEREYCSQTFTAREALSILRHMSDDDARLLGFVPEVSHPMHMIVQNLVVPPPCTRPAVYSSEGSRSRGQNDLTVRLLEIIKRSHEVKHMLKDDTWETFGPVTPELHERLLRLQYEVFVLVNNNVRIQKPPGMGRGGGNVNNKSLTDRLKGKEGRVRGNLMGKRTDFSARCVITPDAYFDCDRVGVPYKIAKTLTVPEIVNATNIQALSKRVRVGTDNVHGAQTVISVDGTVVNLANCKTRDTIVLRPGDVVERHLADDDVVVFNRQPSLHMHGMQTHRVRLMPGHTFRLSLILAAPYNADFDGDEMNLHVPQSRAATAECAVLMAPAQNFIGAQSSKPVLGIVQDSLLGLHLLTQHTLLLDHAHFCRNIGTTRHAPRSLPPPAVVVVLPNGSSRRYWTGKQVISQLFPNDLYVEPERDLDGVDWIDATLPVVVRQGKLLCGVLRKAHVGTATGGIVDVLYRLKGGVHTLRFMGDAQRLTHAFLLQHGHHVGIKDVMLRDDGHTKVQERLEKATRLCEDIQREVVDAPVDVCQTAEQAILRLLSKTLQQTGGIVNEYMTSDNAIGRMVNGGSKGSFINLSQICAALGQQSLEGKRIRVDKDHRTLPCFAPNDLSLASRGMVYNSFSLGLSPSELFMHAIGGREGLVDTAVKTSQTGYASRRMNKSMEDHRVYPDGTIRNALDDVICFRWGGDGMHPAHLERTRLSSLMDPDETFHDRMTPNEAMVALRCKRLILRAKTNVFVTEMDTRVLLPFHPKRWRRFLRRIPREGCGTDVVGDAEAERTVLELVEAVDSLVVRFALLDVFCTSEVRGLPIAVYRESMGAVKRRMLLAIATPGESVGCIAAQSVGEPCTQLTLNTFHTAGVSTKNVTLGIPRLKELLDASRTPKTPCTTLRFLPAFSHSESFAEYMSNTMILTRLGDVVQSCEIVHDPDPCNTVCEDDHAIVRMDSILMDVGDDVSKYVVRLTLHQDLMRARCVTPPMVRRMLAERLEDRAFVSSSEVNTVEWVIRIRFTNVATMVATGSLRDDQEAILCHRAVSVLLDTMVLSGHPHVLGTNVAESNRFAEDGTSHSEYVVHAYGNFLSDCAASHCIDWTRCTSNDVWEVLKTLGIEACTHVLFDQIKTVISFDGTYVDDRHILMLCDTICRGGTLMPLNRHGINRTDASPLMRCSFEETTDVLCDAAIYSDHENARGVTTSIMTGQLAELGTGMTEVLFPEHEVRMDPAPRSRILRSTCRSFVAPVEGPEELEYVFDDMRPGGTRPLSPPTIPESNQTSRKRARFRPVSPTS